MAELPPDSSIYQPQPQHHLHNPYKHPSSERRDSRNHSQSQHHTHRHSQSSVPASNRLSYPPPARIRPEHASHHSQHGSGRTSQQYEHHSRPPSDHSRKQQQHDRRTSSTDSNVNGEIRQYKTHESRRNTRGTIETVGSHDAHHTHHRVSEPRSQERLYNPDDDDEDEDDLSPSALLRAMVRICIIHGNNCTCTNDGYLASSQCSRTTSQFCTLHILDHDDPSRRVHFTTSTLLTFNGSVPSPRPEIFATITEPAETNDEAWPSTTTTTTSATSRWHHTSKSWPGRLSSVQHRLTIVDARSITLGRFNTRLRSMGYIIRLALERHAQSREYRRC